MTHTTRTCATLAVTAASPSSWRCLAVPASAAPELTIRPGSLPRGEDPSMPVVVGDVLVDGARRVPLPDSSVLIGASGRDYVVWTSDGARRPSIWRVQPDGDATLLMRTREAYGAVLSTDGELLAVPRTRVQARQTAVTIHDAVTGEVLQTTTFPGYANLLDLDGDDLVVGTTSPARTTTWNRSTGAKQRVSRLTGYQADVSADRLAVLTDDPYDGGCSVVSTLSDPATVLSESCTERVTDFSPDGGRVALVDLLTDGLGPNRVVVRMVGGRRVATYDAPFFFGLVRWETARALLLQTNGPRKAALVRCVRADCERASRVRSAPASRTSGSRPSGSPGRPQRGPDHRQLQGQPTEGDGLEARAAAARREARRRRSGDR